MNFFLELFFQLYVLGFSFGSNYFFCVLFHLKDLDRSSLLDLGYSWHHFAFAYLFELSFNPYLLFLLSQLRILLILLKFLKLNPYFFYLMFSFLFLWCECLHEWRGFDLLSVLIRLIKNIVINTNSSYIKCRSTVENAGLCYNWVIDWSSTCTPNLAARWFRSSLYSESGMFLTYAIFSF